MTYTHTSAPDPADRPGTVRRVLNWLDERGPMSWVVVMVGSFIFAGPLGLFVLGFILMTGRFGGKACRARSEGRFGRDALRFHLHGMRPTGNAAFDAYRADTLARLEREQDDFEAFLARLREARDKAEFDQYLEERARAAAETPPEAGKA